MTSAPRSRIRCDLAGVRVARGEHDRRDAERPGGIRDALPEVAGRTAHDRPIGADPPLPRQRGDADPRAAALERADRVDRLDLDDDRHAQPLRQAFVDVLGRVAEDARDAAVGGADRRGVELWGADHRGRGSMDRAGHTETPEGTTCPKSTPLICIRDTAFGLGPLRARPTIAGRLGARYGLIHEFVTNIGLSAAPCPHPVHERPHPSSRSEPPPASRTGAPSSVTSNGSPGTNRQPRDRDALETDGRVGRQPPVAAEHDARPCDTLLRRDHGRRVPGDRGRGDRRAGR